MLFGQSAIKILVRWVIAADWHDLGTSTNARIRHHRAQRRRPRPVPPYLEGYLRPQAGTRELSGRDSTEQTAAFDSQDRIARAFQRRFPQLFLEERWRNADRGRLQLGGNPIRGSSARRLQQRAEMERLLDLGASKTFAAERSASIAEGQRKLSISTCAMALKPALARTSRPRASLIEKRLMDILTTGGARRRRR